MSAWTEALNSEQIDQLRELRDGSDEARKQIAELVLTFLNQSTEKLDELSRAVRANDFALSSDLAHAMKGSFGVFGAANAVDLCRSLESAFVAHDETQMHLLMHELTNECEKVQEAVRVAFASK